MILWTKKSVHIHFLVDRVGQKLNDKNSLPLSFSSKIILINTILVAMSSHIMASLPIPLGISEEIKSLFHSFLWANEGRKGITWVKRKTTQLPKGLGGLGIRSPAIVNTCFLMKNAWRIYKSPNLLISKIYQAKGITLMQIGKYNSKYKPVSWGFRGICQVEIQLFRGYSWKIGNGRSIRAFLMIGCLLESQRLVTKSLYGKFKD